MFTRREFATLAAAAMPLPLAAAKLKSTVNGVLIGCQSYSFRDRPLDAAIQAIAEVGLSEVELWQGHVEPKEAAGGSGREELRKWRTTVSLDEFKKSGKSSTPPESPSTPTITASATT